MTDFKNGQELLEVCKKKQCSISEVMKQREIEGTSSTKKEVEDKMRKALAIMKEAVRKPLEDPKPSMSGLIGGEAKQITGYRESGTNVCGTFMNKLIAYSMAVLEVNASMGGHRCGTDCRIFRCGSGSVTGTAGGKRIRR